MLKLKQSAQQAATLSLLVSLVFGSLAPAFSMPVFALEQISNEKPAQQISTSQSDLSQIDLLEKPLEAVPEPIIQPIDIGQINPVEINPEEIIPKEDLLPPDDASLDGDEPELYIQKDEIKSLTDKLNINTDTNTGAFNYTYPIEIPAGRNNLQPDLALSYNNQDTNNQNLFGYSWSLNIPSIERLNKTGIDNLYTDNYFSSSLGGELAPISLSDNIHGTYGPRVENGDFLKYEYTTSSTWIITDKMGIVYTFGKIQADRQDNPNDNTKIYKWMLSDVRDTNDNFIRYQYYKDAGQIYPEKIFYTGHAEADGVFEIEFVREERSDNLGSFQTGFSVTNNYRLSQILVKIEGQWQKKYYLNYETSDNDSRSLLRGIQEAAPSQEIEILMPENEFRYADSSVSWLIDDNFIVPAEIMSSGDYMGLHISEVNGDGLQDIVHAGLETDPNPNHDYFSVNKIHINNGDNWQLESSIQSPLAFVYSDNIQTTGSILADVNGDGLDDVVQYFNGRWTDDVHSYINNGNGWTEESAWNLPEPLLNWLFPKETGVRLIDINGDNLVDVLRSVEDADNRVYMNTGNGWVLDSNITIPVSFMVSNKANNMVLLGDVNGDRLVDILESCEKLNSDDNCSAGSHGINRAYINNGHGWDLNLNWNSPVAITDHYVNDRGARLVDLNDDGLNDFIKQTSIYMNTGFGWTHIDPYMPVGFSHGNSRSYDVGTRLADVNGDGSIDVANYYAGVFLNQSKANNLIFCSDKNGNLVNVSYESSAQSKDINNVLVNPRLPYTIQTVKQINIFDGLATTTIDYQYSGGEQYFDVEHPRDKKFAGFAKVEKISDEKIIKTYYHQGNNNNVDEGESGDAYSKIGKIYKEDSYDTNGELFSRKQYVWQSHDLNYGQFVYLDKSTVIHNLEEDIEVDVDELEDDNNVLVLWHMNGAAGSVDKRANAHSSLYDLNEFGATETNGFDDALDDAYHFNGEDQYLRTSGLTNLRYNNLTIEGWFKLDSFGPGLSPILNQETESGGTYDNARIQVGVNQEHKLYFITEDHELQIPTYQITSNSDIPLNEWVYFVISRENGVHKIYINGTLDAQRIYSGNGHIPAYIDGDLYIGARHNPYHDFYEEHQYRFNGSIDEIRISLIARTAEEIYNKYQHLFDVYHYNFPDTSTAIIYDYDLTNGNLLAENNLGQVDLDINTGEILDTLVGDEKTTIYEYATNEVKHILSAPKEKVITDTTDTKSQELYYDDLAFGQVNKVNLTKEDYLVDNVEINREFNDLGLVVAETDPENNVSEIVYDENNLYPSETINALGQTSLTEYNLLNGQIDRSVAPNGAITENQYDAFGRLIKTWVSNNKSPNDLTLKQEISYDDYSFPRSKSVKDYFDVQRSYLIREYYDGLDRVIQTKKQLAEENSWSTQDTAYDVFGRVSRQSLPYISQSIGYSEPDLNQVAKTYTYDALDRVLTETTPVGTSTYEYNGFTTTIYDANNNRKDLVKDAYGNLVQVKEYNDQDVYTTNYEYSLTNKLTKIIDALGNVRNFVYDDLDNLVWQDMIQRPDVQNIQGITYSYDKNGSVLSQTNLNNQIITYAYDDLNRVLTESVNGGVKIRYTYDEGDYDAGQLTKVEYLDNGNWQEYDYDILGRQTAYRAKIGRENYTLNQVNLLSGDVSYFEYPNGKFVSYVKNSIGQDLLLGVSGENQLFAENLRYNVNGQLIHLERGNGVVTDYTYDPAQAYRLTNILTSNSEAILQNINYTYDAVGNILNITDNASTDLARSATYEYDDLNRLSSTTVSYLNIPNSNYSQSFSYDAIGNILSNSALGEYSYELANPQQLSSVGSQNFVYDNVGNLLTDSQKTLTWDWRSRLQKSQNFGTEDFTNYEYDHQNQRLAKITKTQRLDIEPDLEPIPIIAAAVSTPLPPPIDLPNEITLNEEHYVDQYFEKNLQTGDFKAHIFLNGQKIATINNNNAPYYIISDHLNSSSILVDDAGNIAEVSDYRPFGSEAYSNTIIDLDNDYNFTGKETDEESSLQYFGARYMDNNIGRFVSVDPAVLAFGDGKEFKDKYDRSLEFHLSNPQNLNAYSYVTNNPLRYTDPDGEIIPLLILGYVALEVGFSAWDAYDAGKAWFGEDSSNSDKAWATSGLVAGLVLPGGGYGRVAKVAAKQQDNVLRHVMFGSRKGGLHVLENAVSQGKKIENLQEVGKSGVMMGKIDGRFKTFFPSNWSTQDIKNSLSHLEKNQKMIERNGNVYIQSSKPYKGVYLEGTVNKGSITSFYPSQKLNK
jgi:RHS repeat-associated protein